MVSKNILLEGLNRIHGANPTLSSKVDQDTGIWFARKTPNEYMHHLLEHINQDWISEQKKSNR